MSEKHAPYPCFVCGQPDVDLHDHPHDFSGGWARCVLLLPCLSCNSMHPAVNARMLAAAREAGLIPAQEAIDALDGLLKHSEWMDSKLGRFPSPDMERAKEVLRAYGRKP